MDRSSPPSEFLCPITKQIMLNPVILAASGVTYEKCSLRKWIKENGTDPVTKERLPQHKYTTGENKVSQPSMMTLNHALKESIDQYLFSQIPPQNKNEIRELKYKLWVMRSSFELNYMVLDMIREHGVLEGVVQFVAFKVYKSKEEPAIVIDHIHKLVNTNPLCREKFKNLPYLFEFLQRLFQQEFNFDRAVGILATLTSASSGTSTEEIMEEYREGDVMNDHVCKIIFRSHVLEAMIDRLSERQVTFHLSDMTMQQMVNIIKASFQSNPYYTGKYLRESAFLSVMYQKFQTFDLEYLVQEKEPFQVIQVLLKLLMEVCYIGTSAAYAIVPAGAIAVVESNKSQSQHYNEPAVEPHAAHHSNANNHISSNVMDDGGDRSSRAGGGGGVETKMNYPWQPPSSNKIITCFGCGNDDHIGKFCQLKHHPNWNNEKGVPWVNSRSGKAFLSYGYMALPNDVNITIASLQKNSRGPVPAVTNNSNNNNTASSAHQQQQQQQQQVIVALPSAPMESIMSLLYRHDLLPFVIRLTRNYPDAISILLMLLTAAKPEDEYKETSLRAYLSQHDDALHTLLMSLQAMRSFYGARQWPFQACIEILWHLVNDVQEDGASRHAIQVMQRPEEGLVTMIIYDIMHSLDTTRLTADQMMDILLKLLTTKPGAEQALQEFKAGEGMNVLLSKLETLSKQSAPAVTSSMTEETAAPTADAADIAESIFKLLESLLLGSDSSHELMSYMMESGLIEVLSGLWTNAATSDRVKQRVGNVIIQLAHNMFSSDRLRDALIPVLPSLFMQLYSTHHQAKDELLEILLNIVPSSTGSEHRHSLVKAHTDLLLMNLYHNLCDAQRAVVDTKEATSEMLQEQLYGVVILSVRVSRKVIEAMSQFGKSSMDKLALLLQAIMQTHLTPSSNSIRNRSSASSATNHSNGATVAASLSEVVGEMCSLLGHIIRTASSENTHVQSLLTRSKLTVPELSDKLVEVYFQQQSAFGSGGSAAAAVAIVSILGENVEQLKEVVTYAVTHNKLQHHHHHRKASTMDDDDDLLPLPQPHEGGIGLQDDFSPEPAPVPETKRKRARVK